MDNLVVVFSMKGCPFCDMMKNQLNESGVDYVLRDIDEHRDEYDLFVEVSGSDFVPAFMVISDPYGSPQSSAFVPGKNYNTIEEGVEIIKKIMKG
jgi:glutaredoxin